MAKTAAPKRAGKRAARAAGSPGWLSTDEEEIARRRERGAQERFRIAALEADYPIFGTFSVGSGDGDGRYLVEIVALDRPLNLCDCPDHRVNGLGTCKHVEAVLHSLKKRGKRRYAAAAAAGSPRIEITLERGADGDAVRVLWPARLTARAAAYRLLAPFFSSDDTLLAEPDDALPALRRALGDAAPRVRERVRVSQLLPGWQRERRRRRERRRLREAFLADVEQGKRSLDVVKTRLYPYQQQGMLHLAFGERALLADEMGLGKTVQAIAACELLRRLRDVSKVLVVAPASLKTEWQEQIEKFTGLSSRLIVGSRAERLAQYRQPAFFYLCNYEQILSDGQDIDQLLAPDVIVLDEAQRIKNWQTKTAAAVKRLYSRYAFVLTGTPLENRIDEVYSIVQFLDPAVFGPLFRFNREFYQLDEQGRPTGYKNLDELNRRLQPLMLRRRKSEVEGQLPGRSEKNYYVAMHPEQSWRYDEHAAEVAKLMQAARRRALLPAEMRRLQKHLACMRMLCDTPYILDQSCTVCPKLDELEAVLTELTENDDNKIIVFSEWSKMLDLVGGLAERLGVDYARHDGSMTQPKRRVEINRFKTDAGCRLLLSTDSGSTGLNLQAANVVVNLDLPWNPAKLEQRIARAWRKHQTRSVQVLNFICEASIEQRMMQTLDQKQALADSVIDAAGASAMTLPSGRQAMVERIEGLMGRAAAAAPARSDAAAAHAADGDADPLLALRQDATAKLSDRLLALHRIDAGAAAPTLLAVVDRVDALARRTLDAAVERRLPGARLELLDRVEFDALRRLLDAGVVRLVGVSGDDDQPFAGAAAAPRAARRRRLEAARRRFADAERPRQMAELLRRGDFVVEALAPLRDAIGHALAALSIWLGDDAAAADPRHAEQLLRQGLLPPGAPALLAELDRVAADAADPPAPAAGERLAQAAGELLDHAARVFDRAGLSG